MTAGAGAGAEDVVACLRRIEERLDRLEAMVPLTASSTVDVAAEPSSGAVSYAGAVQRGDDTLMWRIEHDWLELVDDSARTVRVLAALGSPVRLRIVSALLEGDATTGDLASSLDDPSTGQLFHHLKELLAAGVIHQPVRGTYGVQRQDVIPLLAILAAARDVASAGGEPA